LIYGSYNSALQWLSRIWRIIVDVRLSQPQTTAPTLLLYLKHIVLRLNTYE